MKRFALLLPLLLTTAILPAQKYQITFNFNKNMGEKLYIGQHFRDEIRIVDSTTADGTAYTFKGKNIDKGIYCIAVYGNGKEADKLRSLTDFTVDDSYTFAITSDSTCKAELMQVKGSKANELMYAYIGKNNTARAHARDLQNIMKTGDQEAKDKAKAELDALSEEMVAYGDRQMEENAQYYFFRLQKMFNGPTVPDEIEDKSTYYRAHYWDGIDLTDHSLTRTPDLFNKMNYFFFGMLYYSDADTICKYADMLIDRVETDSTMMKYFLDFVMPKYFRSTKNVGWDYAWCHLVRRYYEPNKSKFALPGDVTYKVKEAARLEKSLIGARGAELFMTDTMQRVGAEYMVSSHRFPQKYVILWIWDPDCHHCQEQTAKLIPLYDSLTAIGQRNFEVYAIGYESDINKWKNYVKKNKLPFFNVGGPNVNVDYQEEYNVHGAPTMIILNADREIIMNKTLPAASILPFIEEYEKLHPEQANREPSMWQREGERLWGPQGYNPITYFNLDPQRKSEIENRWKKYRK